MKNVDNWIKILIFLRVLISRRIREFVVDQLALRRLIGCWMIRIWKDRNQRVFVSRHRIWLYWLQLLGARIKKAITLRSFSLSNTLTILPKDGMTLMLMLLEINWVLPVSGNSVLERHDPLIMIFYLYNYSI